MSELVENTSSIGACWPAQVSSNNRIRGFYPAVIEENQDLDTLLTNFEEALQTAKPYEIDRVSFRFCGTASIIDRILKEKVNVEAVLPLHDTRSTGDELHVVYIAQNLGDRVMEPLKLAEHRTLLDKVLLKPTSTTSPEKHIESLGGAIRFIHNSSRDDKLMALVPKFHSLYDKFGFSESDVIEILTSETNTVAYIEDDQGSIISTALAEKAEVKIEGIDGDVLKIVEITEAVTDPDHTGRGYYRALSKCLVNQLVQLRFDGMDHIHAIYGESNLSSPGVIFAAQQNGRIFSANEAARFGAEHPSFGILEQNYYVNDGNETRRYNDFALSYVPLD
jgi:hypothetical protein